ncbi:hypothetical protein ABEB36_013863 [Hypothenemus hampei]|uniref:AB hydrolase-1 domain-containing protein n=1 Tax=Hypothenemus hampei TaxID=57062 RepID=A0ABD1E5H5_HYPHA
MENQEIKIQAPWGKVAGKLWGNPDDTPVLVVHGIMDNAGGFDKLIPLLPKYFYICIDLPGHGRSDHFPPSLPIFTVNYILVYILTMNYFKKDKYIIMGHSYGGQLALLFARMYPERVEKLVLLDTIHYLTTSSNRYLDDLKHKFKEHFITEEKKKVRSPPRYTYEEVLAKVKQNRPFPLTEDAAENLLKRSLIPLDDGKYYLSTDQRLKYFINPIHDIRYAIESIKEHPVQCPLLIIFGHENVVQRHVLRSILNHLKKQKNVTVKYVPGTHDVHQINPEIVAPLINDFFITQKSKL